VLEQTTHCYNQLQGKSTEAQFSKSAAMEDDTYVDSHEVDSFKISRKQIQLADVLAEGKFAVVRKAYFMKMNSKEVVAAKALKSKLLRNSG
jgi:hypothetical protein